jgi:aquaporin Z
MSAESQQPVSATVRGHWPEYLMEAAGLGLFMVSACTFSVLLYHPLSPGAKVISDPLAHRALMGAAMGLTAIAIIFSPWGQQSGAHLNPAVTLTFFRLGRVAPWDALFYVLAQFAGAVAGVGLAAAFLRRSLAHPAVNYAATVPGPGGVGQAFLAEAAISFILMIMILRVSNTSRIARYTGVFAGVLVAAYVTFEAPVSGMSMNPARSFGSAFAGSVWTSLWIYFTAPPLGMLLAAQLYRRPVGCAKLHHQNLHRCIHCGHAVRTESPKVRQRCKD